jgi:hypothetical protein
MKLNSFPALSLVVISGMPLLAHAATLRVPQQHATIQAAIDQAANGDTVRVAAGTYVENLVIDSKAISLIGAGAETTIIDGNAVARVITVTQVSTGTVTIAGFTIRNGQTFEAQNEFQGAGIFGNTVNLFILRDNLITGNRACTASGLSSEWTTIRMFRNRIVDNGTVPECDGSSGVFLHLVGENFIERNVIAGHAGPGAEIFQNDASLQLYVRHNVFRNNGTFRPTGGPFFGAGGLHVSGDLVVDHNLFANNEGSSEGGAYIEQVHSSGGIVRNNSFVGNEAQASGTSGMRIWVASDSNLSVVNNLMNDAQPAEFPEIKCENVPLVIDATNVFASETNGTISGTCTQ